MRCVVNESPYSAETPEGIALNIQYAKQAMHDCLRRGEAPFASHLLYTQVGLLRDDLLLERARGIECNLRWLRKADAVVVYGDYGITSGMWEAITLAKHLGVPVENRLLGGSNASS